MNASNADAALQRAMATYDEIRRVENDAVRAEDWDTAIQAACKRIAAHRAVLAAQVDVDLAAPTRIGA
jgi:hypothetical protein